MELIESQSSGLTRVYRVVVPASELQAQLSAKIEAVRPRVSIKGFRPGKVPTSHIRRVYGPSMMREVIEQTLQERTQSSLQQANLRVAAEPRLDLDSDLEKVSAGEADLAFQLHIEVMPDFEPADVRGIEITRPEAPVEDAQVDEVLANLAKANRRFEDKDAAAEEGDLLTIDFVGTLDGEKFPGGEAEDAQLEIGSKRFIPGFEEQLIGAAAGDERTIDVTFPDDYPVETLKGQAAQFAVTVKQVKSPVEAGVDEALATAMGFETLDALNAAVRERVEADHKAQSRLKAKRALFDELDTMHTFDLPPGMVQSEFDQIWAQIERDRQSGQLDPDDADKSDDDLKAEYRRIAERRVRLGLVLAEIGRRNNVEIRQDEVDAALLQRARSFPGREQQVLDAYRRNPNLMAELRAPIYEDKVVDFIFELAKVNVETVTREALFADEDAPAEG
jgi:trigger factor